VRSNARSYRNWGAGLGNARLPGRLLDSRRVWTAV